MRLVRIGHAEIGGVYAAVFSTALNRNTSYLRFLQDFMVVGSFSLLCV